MEVREPFEGCEAMTELLESSLRARLNGLWMLTGFRAGNLREA